MGYITDVGYTRNGKPVYSNGTYYLYYHYTWIISPYDYDDITHIVLYYLYPFEQGSPDSVECSVLAVRNLYLLFGI